MSTTTTTRVKAAVGWASSCKLGQGGGYRKRVTDGGATAPLGCSSSTIVPLNCGYRTSQADNLVEYVQTYDKSSCFMGAPRKATNT